MKQTIKLFSVALVAGAVSVGGYKILESKTETNLAKASTAVQPIKLTPTNYTSNSPSTTVDFSLAAEKTVDAVVHVISTTISKTPTTMMEYIRGNGRPTLQQGSGSGVIISPDGYIITNNHVIDNASQLEVTLNNNTKYIASVIGTDPKTDIALLKIESENLFPYIAFSDSNNVKLGEWVLAVGNPFRLTSTVTAGIVSAKSRDLDQTDGKSQSFIQTDAAVNPGNSGGALVNSRGELVGINTAISSKTGSYIGYSFAVPSNITKKIIDDILEFGKVQEAIIGFVPDLRKDDIEGVVIGDFTEGSNAEKAGLAKGDIIVKINDVKISKFSELTGQLSAKRPGESVELIIDRNGQIFTKSVNLIKRVVRYISRSYGIELIDDPQGAKIIRDGLPEESSSSIRGYIITEINGTEIQTASEAIKLLDGLSRNGYRLKVEMIDLNGEANAYFF